MILKRRATGTVEFVFVRESDEPPHLMGSWDAWQFPGIPMTRDDSRSQTWKAAVQLSPGEHQFRYRIGNDWFNDSSADRYVDNGLGTDNSVVIVEEAPRKRRPEARRVASGQARSQRKRPPRT